MNRSPQTPSPQTWYLERTSPVRADAEGLFIPAADLPDATIGDVVIVRGNEGDARAGTIADTTEADDEPFFRLELHV
jgi:hypothetical protein